MPMTFCAGSRKSVRKSAAGNANARDVPVVIQTRLKWVVMHTKCRYMTQRALEFNNAPLEQLQGVALPKPPLSSAVGLVLASLYIVLPNFWSFW